MNETLLDNLLEASGKLERMEPRRLKEHVDMYELGVLEYVKVFEDLDYKEIVKNDDDIRTVLGGTLKEVYLCTIESITAFEKNIDIKTTLELLMMFLSKKDINSLTYHRVKIYVVLRLGLELEAFSKDFIVENFVDIYTSGYIEQQMFYNMPMVKYSELEKYLPELADEDTKNGLRLALEVESPLIADYVFDINIK